MTTAGTRALCTSLLLFVLWSCGGGSDSGAKAPDVGTSATAASQRIDACSLLTAEDVGAALGETFTKGRLEEHGTGAGERYFSICVFDPVDSTSLASLALTVRPAPEVTDPAAALEAQAQDMRANAVPDYTFDSVPELGAGAGWDGASHQLTIFRPGLMMLLSAQGKGDLRGSLVQLAQKALAAANAAS